MSFMVTVRERRQYDTLTEDGHHVARKRWEVSERFEAETAKEGLDRAVRLLNNNPECSVTIMRKR